MRRKDTDRLVGVLCARPQATRGATTTVTESKGLKRGTGVCRRAGWGLIEALPPDAVTIFWSNGKVGTVHHGDMREIQRAPKKQHFTRI
jgi:hypothetical protein